MVCFFSVAAGCGKSEVRRGGGCFKVFLATFSHFMQNLILERLSELLVAVWQTFRDGGLDKWEKVGYNMRNVLLAGRERGFVGD